MKIDQSNVSLHSSHAKHYEVKEKETLKKWNRSEDTPEFKNNHGDKLALSDTYKSIKQNKAVLKTESDGLEPTIDPKLMEIIRALEALTGHKIDTSFLRKLNSNGQNSANNLKNQGNSDGARALGWGIDYNYQRTEIHEESLDFSAQGNVKTSDGKSIDFSLAMSMKSSTEVSKSLSFKAGDALTDPLVINFGADTVKISDVQKKFDLNLDGKSNAFNFVGEGSGFLAIDKNGDGRINDGSELFGPTKGNGFDELKAYDSDKNGWIDENDDVFKKLLIWTKDKNGDENLYSLKQKNIGALYLNSANTQFNLKDSTYTSKGDIKESSLYIKENGCVGTLQEVDLKTY